MSNPLLVFWVIALLVIMARAIYRTINVEYEYAAKELAFAASIKANKELIQSFDHSFATLKYKKENLTFCLHGILHSKAELYSLEAVQGQCAAMLDVKFGAGRIEKITQIGDVVEIVLR